MTRHAIDVVVCPFTPETKQSPYEHTVALKESFILFDCWDKEFTNSDLVAEMDSAGIAKSFICAQAGGSWCVPYDYIERLVAPYSGRLYGLAGIDPRDIVAGVAQLDEGITTCGFVGAHSYPHWFGLRPDDARYYPFYTKCVELDIPIEIQIGQAYQRTLVGVAFPSAIDRVAADFPDLRLVGIHTGYPWDREFIALAWKHPNFYIGGDNRHPSTWSTDLVEFIKGEGQSKVLWGSNKPAVQPSESMAGVRALGLSDTAEDALLSGNARRVFKIEEPDEGNTRVLSPG